MDIETKNENVTVQKEKRGFKLPKLSKWQIITASVVVAVVAIVLVLQFSKGVFVAATVNGSPISRLSVIGELEERSGKQALDSLITEKIIEKETKNISVSQEEVDSEIKKIEERIASQGGMLDMVLAQQGMTREQLKEQITVQKKIEKLLADKVQISDEEVNTYIRDNKITSLKGQTLEDVRAQAKEQLRQQKFGQLAQQWVGDLRAGAKIKYYTEY